MSSQNQPGPAANVDFSGIIEWYQRHCDGSWEHRYGVRLETLDNPGWLLTIDLIHTDLQGRTMTAICEGISPENQPVSPGWFHCSVSDHQFRGACDPTQVARLFQIFNHFRSGQAAG